MDPIELPHGELPPPMLPPSSQITWLPRRRRHTPRHQRQPWQDPRIANIIQRAAPAFVAGQVASASASTGTITVTLPSNVTAGNCIVVAVGELSNAITFVVTDGLGNLYVNALSESNTGNCRQIFFVANNSVGGACTVNVGPVSVATTVTVLEYSGVGSVAGNRTIVDGANGLTANASTTTFSFVPQQSGSLGISAICDATGGLTWAVSGAGANRRSSVTTTCDLAVADGVLSSTSVANQTTTWSNGGTTTQLAAGGIVLRPAGTQAVVRLGNINQTTGASTWSTFNITPKLGAVLLCAVATSSTSATTSSVIDSQGNTWTLIPGSRSNNASGGEASLWLCNGASSASSAAVQVTLSASATGAALVYELSGVLPSAATVDIVATATGNGTSVSVGPTSATAIAGETALLVVGTPGSASGVTPGGGASLWLASQAAQGTVAAESLTLNATGAQTMTATLGTSSQWSAILITVNTGGVSLVQSASAGGKNGTSWTQSLPFNSAPGDLLTAWVATNGGGAGATGLTDGPGNAWSKGPEAGSGAKIAQLWEAPNGKGGAVTATATFGSSRSGQIYVVEYSGIATTSPLDVSGVGSGSSTAMTATVSATPNYLLELVVFGAFDLDAGATDTLQTLSPPFALTNSNLNNGGSGVIGHMLQLSPGAVPSSPSCTATIPSAQTYAAAIATFKIAGSGAYTPLSGAVASASAATGTVSLTHVLTGTSGATSSASLTAALTHSLTGAATSLSAGTAMAALTHQLTAFAGSLSSASLVATLTHRLSGSSASQSAASGTFSLTHILHAAAVAGQSAVTGTLQLTHRLAGLVASTSTWTARFNPTLPPRLSATIAHAKQWLAALTAASLYTATITTAPLFTATMTHAKEDATDTSRFHVGDRVVFTVVLVDQNGDPPPDTMAVSAALQSPDLRATPIIIPGSQIAQESVDTFSFTYQVTQSGQWTASFYSTSANDEFSAVDTVVVYPNPLYGS